MPTTAAAKGRLDVRIAARDKSLIEKAAAISGKSLSEFLIPMAVRRAKRIIQQSTTITLSERDFRLFLDTLDAEPKPNAALRKAMAEYDRLYGQPVPEGRRGRSRRVAV
ncbi:MAG TPA: DUF1778 domain-containing protein [Planctomycetota bacterium]